MATIAQRDDSLRTLTEAELKQITRARYEALQLLECAGNAYTRWGGAREVSLARRAYEDARAEVRRREALAGATQ